MNTPPPSDSESSSFNGFGSYRRKRDSGNSGPKGAPYSFRRIPRDEFSDGVPSDDRESAAERPPRPYGGRNPFGKKPFGKKPFGKKPFGFKKGPGFHNPFHPREFDTIEDGEAPAPAEDAPFLHERPSRHDGDHDAPRGDRSFKHAPRRYGDHPDRDGDFKPFGKKPFGKKKPFGNPFGKGPRQFRERPDDGEAADFGAPRPLRRPYGAPADGEFSTAPGFDAAPAPEGRNPFGKKPFGKKPFGKKPFGKKPFGKPFGKNPFGKKPFGKRKPFGGNSFGKKPFGKKPGKRPGPRD